MSETCRRAAAATLNRRSALSVLSTAAVTSVLGNATAAADSPTSLIDAHVHVWTPDVTRYPLADGYRQADMQPGSFTPDELMRHAVPAGVGQVVLIQMSYYGTDNSYMLDVIAAQPDVFRGVAIIDENQSPQGEMKRLSLKGVRGFRIQPRGKSPQTWLSGDGMRHMWTAAADEGLAICHLINPEYLPSVHAMCKRFPRTPVVIDHFARIGIDGRIRDADLEQLCRLSEFPEVTVKVSAFYALGRKQPPYTDLTGMIARMRQCFGADRLMWASDCPFQVQDNHTYAASIDLIRSGIADLTDGERTALLRTTAARVFFGS
jgi:predicted TIM-barrel fold metal-dependent hydrolase